MNSLTHLKICIIFLNFDVLKCIKYDCGLIPTVSALEELIITSILISDWWDKCYWNSLAIIFWFASSWRWKLLMEIGIITKEVEFLDRFLLKVIFFPCTHMCPWPIYITNNVLILMKATELYQHLIPEMRFHTGKI